MKDYSTYSSEDLAADPSFINWVLKTNLGHVRFWEQWVGQYPERQEVVEQAKEIVLGVHLLFTDQSDLSTLKFDKQRLLTRVYDLQSELPVETGTIPVRSLWTKRWITWTATAAAVSLLLLAGIKFYPRADFSRLAAFAARTPPDTSLIERVNTNIHPQTVLLSDGSVVTLEPNSRLTYPRVFAMNARQVNLVGEAFFEVARNPAKPFFVFTRQAITKVLGTSFHVRAFTQEPTVNVRVRTGKVAVYANSEKQLTSATTGSILLYPNQQVSIRQGRLQKETTARPDQVAATQVGPSEIIFDDQPVSNVLLTLARLYSVTIIFNNKDLEQCRITTSFDEETLPERLSIICQAIKATYTIENDHITIAGRSCSLTTIPNP